MTPVFCARLALCGFTHLEQTLPLSQTTTSPSSTPNSFGRQTATQTHAAGMDLQVQRNPLALPEIVNAIAEQLFIEAYGTGARRFYCHTCRGPEHDPRTSLSLFQWKSLSALAALARTSKILHAASNHLVYRLAADMFPQMVHCAAELNEIGTLERLLTARRIPGRVWNGFGPFQEPLATTGCGRGLSPRDFLEKRRLNTTVPCHDYRCCARQSSRNELTRSGAGEQAVSHESDLQACQVIEGDHKFKTYFDKYYTSTQSKNCSKKFCDEYRCLAFQMDCLEAYLLGKRRGDPTVSPNIAIPASITARYRQQYPYAILPGVPSPTVVKYCREALSWCRVRGSDYTDEPPHMQQMSTRTIVMPLHLAAVNGHLEAIRILVANGANIEDRSFNFCEHKWVDTTWRSMLTSTARGRLPSTCDLAQS